MRIVMFYHSLLSDWNHGNAHFLRGVVSELRARGHEVSVYEPVSGWSRRNLVNDHGRGAIEAFHKAYPGLSSELYDETGLDLDRALDAADLVIVHEWNRPELVARIGAHRARARSYRLLLHDTHHRAVSAREELARFDLRDYDGVLAFGAVLRDRYLHEGWTQHAWTWHEAADTRVFHPPVEPRRVDDLVWVGNWGDGERTRELDEFLLEPIAKLQLRASIYGVRYPQDAQARIAASGARYCGFIPNFEVPHVFAQHKATVHVPRRYYSEALPGIPTIRVFEALACGIPLVTAPWRDVEGLFNPGEDFLVARNGEEMVKQLRALLSDADLQQALAARGLATVLSRHTCGQRVTELLDIYKQLTGHR